MRILSWLAGIVVVVALAVGATSVARAHSNPTHALLAAKPAAASYNTAEPDDPPRHETRQTSEPTPTPEPVVLAAEPPAAAPPAAPAPAPPPPPPPPAPPPVVVGSTQQALINQDRAAAGLGPLTWSTCLYNVAVSNANRMAAQGFISHANGPNVDLTCGLGHQAGENVGWWSKGVNDTQLNTMFMNSPDHRANILGPYHYVATAWVVAANGYGYIAVEFS
ncbi:MAG TPA: CAP domain-containing protein [Candidatus Nitrosotalea sp.]|nr:CAP domain-containing protein [Candidatus Nitrosotalea sp.]